MEVCREGHAAFVQGPRVPSHCHRFREVVLDQAAQRDGSGRTIGALAAGGQGEDGWGFAGSCGAGPGPDQSWLTSDLGYPFPSLGGRTVG